MTIVGSALGMAVPVDKETTGLHLWIATGSGMQSDLEFTVLLFPILHFIWLVKNEFGVWGIWEKWGYLASYVLEPFKG